MIKYLPLQFILQIKQSIEKLEKENLRKKPWQLSGEAGSNTRPLNSLLEEDLAFDHTAVTGTFRTSIALHLTFFIVSFEWSHCNHLLYILKKLAAVLVTASEMAHYDIRVM